MTHSEQAQPALKRYYAKLIVEDRLAARAKMQEEGDESISGLCVRQGQPRVESMAASVLSKRYGGRLDCDEAVKLWVRRATPSQFLEAAKAAQ